MTPISAHAADRCSRSSRSRYPGKPIGAGLAIVAIVLLGGPAQAATVVVVVDGIQAVQSRVFVSLCSNGLDPADCPNGQTAAASGGAMAFTFEGVQPAILAVAAFQDLNGNGTLDRSQNGLPLEPYGFSNNAGRRSKPRFDAAAVSVQRDTTLTVHLSSLLGRR